MAWTSAIGAWQPARAHLVGRNCQPRYDAPPSDYEKAMIRTRLPRLTAGLVLALAACSRYSSNAAPPARVLVTTGTNVVEPSQAAPPAIDLTHLGATRIDAHYRLTTPANTPFQFELVTWQANDLNYAQIVVDHVSDGGVNVDNDPLSLARVGLVPLANYLISDGEYTVAIGGSFVRLTLLGRIEANQVFAVGADGRSVVTIELAIGEESVINRLPATEPDVAGVVSRDTIYSSPSWLFGYPTVAVSGDRASVVCYEGDRATATADRRFEQRLQFDAATHAVTGGAASLGIDVRMSRDHEVVALYNVLGVVRADAEGVRVRLSFDRGATFAQDVQVLDGASHSRIVQAAMANDYSLAIGTWRVGATGLEFVLVRGYAAGFDAFGSPTWFQFLPAEVVHTAPAESSPLTTGIAWSEGDDLAVGYAFNWFASSPGGGWTSTTEFRCATARFGAPLVDVLVDEESMYGMDPTVAVLGQGSTLRVFYAYEVRDGVRLATSSDGGASFARGPLFGQAGDHLPSVFARELGGQTHVDVLCLAGREFGTELHRTRWLDWPNDAPVEEALTRATMQQVPFSQPTGGSAPPFATGLKVKQVNFLGYDAVRDGDQLVVAYDEVEFDNVYLCTRMYWPYLPVAPAPGHSPPPLAPGLTEPMPAPNPEHSHQLKLLRLQ